MEIGFWRRAAEGWWAAGQYDALETHLSGSLKTYDPVTYLFWGRLMALRGRRVDAGMYLLISGLYTEAETRYVDAFRTRCSTMVPSQVVSQFPKPCHRRWARERFSERVVQDCEDLRCPEWFMRPARSSGAKTEACRWRRRGFRSPPVA